MRAEYHKIRNSKYNNPITNSYNYCRARVDTAMIHLKEITKNSNNKSSN